MSLKKWLEEDSILVLGFDTTLRTPMSAINTVIMNRLMELILAQDDSDTRKITFFLDEFLLLGVIKLLPLFLDMARSKGVYVFLGVQTIEGLYDVYGENRGERIASICCNKGILRTDSRKTADWGSKTLGDAHVKQRNKSVTTSKEGIFLR